MTNIIVTTEEQLGEVVRTSVQKALDSFYPQSSQVKEDTLLNINEAASYLNLAKQTLYGFTSKNKIPHIKRAKRLLFKKSDLDLWLHEGHSGVTIKTENGYE